MLQRKLRHTKNNMSADPGRTRRRRPARLIVMAVIALVLIGFFGLRVASSSGLNRELAEVRRQGLPTNPKELDAWYARVPDSENAALKFIEAQSHFVEPSKANDPGAIEWRDIPHDAALEASVVAMLEEHVRKNEPALRLAHEAAQLTRSRYPSDLSRAPDVSLSHLMQMRGLAQLLRWEAVLKAERGDGTDAAKSLRTGFALAHTVGEEPLLISELVRMAYLAIHLNGIERVVNVGRFREEDLAQLAAETQKAAEDCGRFLNRALIGERAFANTGKDLSFAEYEQTAAFTGFGPVGEETPEFVRKGLYNLRQALGVHKRDFAFYLQSLGRLIDATALEHPRFLQESQRVSDEITAQMTKRPFVYMLSRVSLPSMIYAPKKEAVLAARLRCVSMALEIERFRARNEGRLPRIDELVPALIKEAPTDPIDGKPLEYRVGENGKGYRILAVGATATERSGNTGARVQDVAFTVLK